MNDVFVTLKHAVEHNLHFADIAWMQNFRLQQFQKFLQRGLPTRQEEHWKYSDVAAKLSSPSLRFSAGQPSSAATVTTLPVKALTDHRLVFVDGHYNAALSCVGTLPPGVVLCPNSLALQMHEEKVKKYLLQTYDSDRYPFATLNAALLADGLFLYVPKNTSITMPIEVLYITRTENCWVAPRNIVIAEENASVTIVEDFLMGVGGGLSNNLTHFSIGKHANVNFYKIQNEHPDTLHLDNIMATVQGCLQTHFIMLGGSFGRDSIYVGLTESGAACSVQGLHCTQYTGQHFDSNVHIDHAAPHSNSEIMYKHIVDKKARAVFNGKVHVKQNAQHIRSHQASHGLLLDSQAEINTRPELEIYADSVQCTHAATVGQLDENILFYLCSRGIPYVEARQMLTYAFLAALLDTIKESSVRDRIQTALNPVLPLNSLQLPHSDMPW